MPAAFLAPLFTWLARFLLSGLIARVIVVTILNTVIFAAIFLFYKNFAGHSLDYALGFFSFFGFGDIVRQIQTYWSQVPEAFRDIASYFELGAAMALLVNSYISSIFLAWIMRRFG